MNKYLRRDFIGKICRKLQRREHRNQIESPVAEAHWYMFWFEKLFWVSENWVAKSQNGNFQITGPKLAYSIFSELFCTLIEQ
jgi:hypothetical protein